MRKLLTLLFVVLSSKANLQAEPRIALISYKQIIEQYRRSQTVSKEFKLAQDQLKQELQTKWDAFQKLIDQAANLQKEINDPLLSQDQRFQKHQEFKTLELKIENEKKVLREFKANREKVFQQNYQIETEKVIKEVAQAAAHLAREKKYDLVLNNSDVTSHASPLIQYIKSGNDITSLLIEYLNKK